MKNILLLGRKEWSAKALEYLLEQNYNVLGIVGKQRKNEMNNAQSSLVRSAEHNNIAIYSEEEIYTLIDSDNQTFNNQKVDLLISYLFSNKIKKELLDITKIAAINLHPAPLPEYQGLGGYNAAILDGLDYYGVTAHLMNEKIDAGDILKVKKFNINDKETAFSLEQKSMNFLLELFKEIFSSNFDTYLNNRYKNEAHSGKYINKKEFENMKFIRDYDSSEIVDKKIRAFWYPPYEGAKIKVGDEYYTLTDQVVLNEVASKYHQ